MARQVRLASLEAAARELAALEKAADPRPTSGWTLSQILNHCAASIELSISGYPKPRSFLVRAVAGPLVLRKFLRQGFMTHDRAAEIPGAEPAPPEGDPLVALARLRKAISDFEVRQGELAPHFAYGKVSKEEYDRVHAMHIADHLSAIDY